LSCIFPEYENCVPKFRLCTMLGQCQHCMASLHNLEIAQLLLHAQFRPRSSSEFPSCIKVKNVRTEPLQLHHHHQCWECTQAPCTRDFWEVCQLGETPFPSVWVQVKRDPRLVECPLSRLHKLEELSPLSPNYIRELNSCNHDIWWNLKIGHAISRLSWSVWILRMCSVISRLCKFLDYIHSHI